MNTWHYPIPQLGVKQKGWAPGACADGRGWCHRRRRSARGLCVALGPAVSVGSPREAFAGWRLPCPFDDSSGDFRTAVPASPSGLKPCARPSPTEARCLPVTSQPWFPHPLCAVGLLLGRTHRRPPVSLPGSFKKGGETDFQELQKSRAQFPQRFLQNMRFLSISIYLNGRKAVARVEPYLRSGQLMIGISSCLWDVNLHSLKLPYCKCTTWCFLARLCNPHLSPILECFHHPSKIYPSSSAVGGSPQPQATTNLLYVSRVHFSGCLMKMKL